MSYTVRTEGEYTFIDEGEGEVLLLLHGLFGALSNWEHVINTFSKEYRVVIPMMPIYDMPLRQAGIDGLCDFIEGFVKFKNLRNLNLLGNSLGGHIGLVYAMRHPNGVRRMVLTGSSGLFENGMGGSFPKRGNYEFVREKVAYTFYDPATATKELVDEVFETTKSIPKCLRIVAIAKSAQRTNLAGDLNKVKVPVLLVWGLNDTITPAHVAHEFHRLLPHSFLHFIDKCCHVPMMEHPATFNKILSKFLLQTAPELAAV
ncbi:MAG: alpha/beta fold hydrolase [Bacteroidota bacterium]